MSEDCVELKIPNSRQKLRSLFPLDPRGDFKVVFKSKVFKLQKAYLRLQSSYFKKKFDYQSDLTILQIKEQFAIHPQYLQQQLFSSVLSCFYGNKIGVPRQQLLLYYPIIKFLEVDSLLTQVRKDMVEHVQNYDIFVLMKMAHQYNQQQIFQTCLFQLQKEGFEQMNYSNSELLNCSVQLFKLIIKTHNRTKSQGKKGLDYKCIDNFIKQYCETHDLDEDKYREYKFQLIDKTKLTAKQYKEIFMDELNKPRQQIKQSYMKTANNGFKSNESSPLTLSSQPMYESMIGPFSKTFSNELNLQMENTFIKKSNEQLKQEKEQLLRKVKQLKETTESNKLVNNKLQKQLQDLRSKLETKDKSEKEQKGVITRFEDMMKTMEKSLSQKDSSIKKLQNKVQQLCKMVNSRDFRIQDEEDSLIIQSQIIPSNLIGDLMKKQVKSQNPPKAVSLAHKKELAHSFDDQEIQQSYQDRISFDSSPISIPKAYIPILLNFLGTTGFNKKKLKLLFRRSDNHQQFGDPNNLRNKNEMVFLIKTGGGQYIGAYISVSIDEDVNHYIQDKNAYIFSLSRGKKFNVKASNSAEAAFISPDYLIGFGNDLFISKDVLNEESYCDWSSSYEKGQKQQQGPVWFAGGYSFMIKHFQVYEIDEDQMIMTID